MPRGQVPLPLLEAAIGVLLLTTVVVTVAVGVPAADTSRVQLDAYASDAATLLSDESPHHGEQTRLTELAANSRSFERERTSAQRRLERILPANLFYRVRTPHGTIGYRQPPGLTVGRATVRTGQGAVTIEVWYA